MVRKSCSGVVLLFGLLFLLAGNISAQNTTGMILGTVLDSSGASVSGASVTIANQDQNVVVRSLTTDESGQYVAPQLPVGRYTVTVELKGFKKAVRTGLTL